MWASAGRAPEKRRVKFTCIARGVACPPTAHRLSMVVVSPGACTVSTMIIEDETHESITSERFMWPLETSHARVVQFATNRWVCLFLRVFLASKFPHRGSAGCVSIISYVIALGSSFLESPVCSSLASASLCVRQWYLYIHCSRCL